MYFENRSHTPELDWLREGLADMLITDLSRSAQLTVLNRQQLHQLLERAGQRPGETIQPAQALAISRKSQAESFVLGSFARLGEKLRVDLQLYDTVTGRLVASESLTVDRVEQLLSQVDLLALKLAARLGAEPTQDEQRVGLGDVMTNNLEAYRSYSLALEKTYELQSAEAIALFEKAVALDPQFAMAYGRIGYTYAVTEQYAEKAKPYLEKAFQLSSHLTEKDRFYINAWYAIANLDYTGAVRAFRKIISQYPMEVEAYRTLGYLLRGEGQHDEAIRVLKQSLLIDQEARDVHNALGLIYLDLHKYDQAIAAHQRYVQLAPAEPNAYDSLGMSYQSAGRYAEALAAYGQALALQPDHFIASIHRGNAYVQLGRYESALAQFRRLVQLAPNDFARSRAYGSIAETYLRMNDLKQAAEAARMELQLEKYNVWNSVRVALQQGDAARVAALEGPLFADWPYTVRGQRFPARLISYRRGYLALKRGQSAQAIAHFKEALRHPPLIWMIDPLEDCLANAYLELGQLDDAIKEYKRVLHLNENYPLAHYHLAQAYERNGQHAEARVAYARFRQVWKDADAQVLKLMAPEGRR
jgi:tetratricopeptide (TPR) repeat protein